MIRESVRNPERPRRRVRSAGHRAVGPFRIALAFLIVAAPAAAFLRAQGDAPPSAPGDRGAPILTISPVEVRVLGQDRWIAGSRASLRILVSDHDRGVPLESDVRIALRPKEGIGPERILFTGRTGPSGTLDASFPVPRSASGAHRLEVGVASSIGEDLFGQEITIEESADLYLTTDKPIYQPGQTIHLRALALRKPDRKPFRAEAIAFEIEDAKGNKVFRKAIETDRYGVASADFVLAHEVNQGLYTLRAANPAATAEKKVTVERYVLPKFKVEVKAARSYYRPGERVEGTLQADYFFGKPVAGGRVAIRVSTLTVGVEEIGRIEGTTDASGSYRFEYVLPEAFVGQPLDRGRATVQFEAAVVDGADHQEKGRLSVPVSRDLMDVVIVPASRDLVPGVPNTLYIATAYPDGTPAAAEITVRTEPGDGPPSTVRADDLGIASWTFIPGAAKVTLHVEAIDDRGRSARAGRELTAGARSGEAVILAASRALASVGDTVSLTVFSPARAGAVYLDVVKDGQTALTRALDLENGRARTTLPLTPDLAGTIQIHAYRILPSEEIVRDTRTIYVGQADDLAVSIRPAQETHRPGEEAQVDFAVTGPDGRGVASALGVAGVDESVFALSELQPGLEKIYFTLERELMEPRYEIHGLEPSGIVGGGPLPIPPPAPEDRAAIQRRERARDRAARILFAAAPVRGDFTIRANTYRARFARAKASWLEAMAEDHEAIRQALERWRSRHVNGLPPGEEERLVEARILQRADLEDPWGRAYRIRRRNGRDDVFFAIRSAGPDGRWSTEDDLEYGPEMMRRRGDLVFDAMPVAALQGIKKMAPGVPGVMVEADALRMQAMETGEAGIPALAPAAGAAGGVEPIRIREYFPETLFWNPSVITDGSGRARVTIPLADSITTWRLTALASDGSGRLGSAQSPLRVFQDFFVDLDLPLWLTRGDEIGIPIALYNYLREPQTVSLTLEPGDWFEALPGEGPAARAAGRAEVSLGAGEVAGIVFPIRVEKFGRHTLTVTARGSRLSDAIRKPIEVLPEGREFRDTVNDRLDRDVTRDVTIPAVAIPGASSLFVKIYPGIFSQAVEGLDALLRMPGGCFEQTSSTTYPNVLVLAYLKETKQANPELRMKAEQYINVGYQRLLTFEVQGGGFSWFGDAPAHQVLTAYGLLEFADMAKVHDVDPALIERTQRWLAGRQKQDGTWERDQGGIAEGIINRQSDTVRTTAYIAWALSDSGYKGPEVGKALEMLRGEIGRLEDPYAAALVANAFAAADRRSDEARRAAERLASMKEEKDGGAFWRSKDRTFTGAAEGPADLETTGLAAYALLRTGVQPETARKALTHLIRNKDAFGTWQTTQATVWALRALLATMASGSAETDATVRVVCNGEEAASLTITPKESDLMRQVDCGTAVRDGRNEIRLTFEGEGNLLYQIVSRYYVPWDRIPAPPTPILSIDVDYDRTSLAKNEIVTEKVRVTNNTPAVATNVIVDLAVPPGFELMAQDLEALVGKEIARFEPAGRQIIVYVDRVDPGRPLEFSFRMRATMMVRAVNGESAVYPYYNPEQREAERPVVFRTAAAGTTPAR